MSAPSTASRSRWGQVLRTPMGLVASVLLVLLATTALGAPMLWGEAASKVDPDAFLLGASTEHPLGTDTVGRDIALRVLVAVRLSVLLALAATAVGVVAGVLLGTAPTVLPRRVGRLVTAAVNIAVAFPALLLVLFFAVIFGVSTTGAVFAVGLAMVPGYARLTQTLAGSVAGHDYIAAARLAGANRVQVLLRHVLPNIGEPLVIQATITAGGALVAFAGLSFLGIGVQAPSYDLGRLLSEGVEQIYLNPAAALGPALVVVLAGLAFNLFGESAAAALGGRSRTVRAGRTQEPVRRVVEPAGHREHDLEPVLTVEQLEVSFPGEQGWTTPVRGVGFEVLPGESVGLVGESGSGKSLTALAVSRLLEEPARVRAERLEFDAVGLLDSPERELRQLLGNSLSMVFQNPMTSFNPTRRIGRQLAEVAQRIQGLDRRAAFDRAVDRLGAVRVPAPGERARMYAHELSGGMRQRAMIAMGLMGTPKLIIADEPTTALDVTVQQEVLRLLARVREETGAALLMISHDLLTVAESCDRVLVMYAGRIVEDLPVADLERAEHPYTRLLLAVVPDFDTDRTVPLPVIGGTPPSPSEVGTGCAFAARCPRALDRCRSEDPALVATGDQRRVACWNPVPAAAALTVSNEEAIPR